LSTLFLTFTDWAHPRERDLSETGISPDTRVRDLTEEEVSRIRETIDKNYKVEEISVLRLRCTLSGLSTLGLSAAFATGETSGERPENAD
jgi:hypothetical protein